MFNMLSVHLFLVDRQSVSNVGELIVINEEIIENIVPGDNVQYQAMDHVSCVAL